MNFDYSEDQLAIADVANRIFKDLCGDEAIRQLFKTDQPLHRELWQQLATSGLLAAPLPAEQGGSGMGLTEFCIVVEAQGRSVAPVPLIETVVECALPISRFGSDALCSRLLPGVISGELMLAAVRPYSGLLQRKPLKATAGADGSWRLDGDSSLTLYAPVAHGFLVEAETDSGVMVGFVDAQAKGVSVVAQRSGGGELAGLVRFSGVMLAASDVLASGSAANDVLEWQRQRTFAAMAAQQVGILREGLRRAAEYTNERKQFGRSLSSFQAVAQQAADAYMAIEALRSVYWRAVDDIDNRGDATEAARVAKFWLCESGHTAAHIYLHIHGGIGQDLDYPLHRFFTWAKKNEVYLGGAQHHAAALGRQLRDRYVAAATR